LLLNTAFIPINPLQAAQAVRGKQNAVLKFELFWIKKEKM
jgi:hypothetical protein